MYWNIRHKSGLPQKLKRYHACIRLLYKPLSNGYIRKLFSVLEDANVNSVRIWFQLVLLSNKAGNLLPGWEDNREGSSLGAKESVLSWLNGRKGSARKSRTFNFIFYQFFTSPHQLKNKPNKHSVFCLCLSYFHHQMPPYTQVPNPKPILTSVVPHHSHATQHQIRSIYSFTTSQSYPVLHCLFFLLDTPKDTSFLTQQVCQTLDPHALSQSGDPDPTHQLQFPPYCT